MIRTLSVIFLLFFFKICYADLINYSPSYVNLINNAPNFEASIYLNHDKKKNFVNERYSVFADKISFFESKNIFQKYQSKELKVSEIFTNLFQFRIKDNDTFNEDEIILIFKKNYNKNWKLFYSEENFGASKFSFYLYYLKSYIFNPKSNFSDYAIHKQANYVLNAWLIQNKSKQLLNNNFYIFYQPQIFYEVGLFLSFLIAFISFLLIIFFAIQKIFLVKSANV